MAEHYFCLGMKHVYLDLVNGGAIEDLVEGEERIAFEYGFARTFDDGLEISTVKPVFLYGEKYVAIIEDSEHRWSRLLTLDDLRYLFHNGEFIFEPKKRFTELVLMNVFNTNRLVIEIDSEVIELDISSSIESVFVLSNAYLFNLKQVMKVGDSNLFGILKTKKLVTGLDENDFGVIQKSFVKGKRLRRPNGSFRVINSSILNDPNRFFIRKNFR